MTRTNTTTLNQSLEDLPDAARQLLFGEDDSDASTPDPSDDGDASDDSETGSFEQLVLVIGAAGAGSTGVTGLLSRHPHITLPDNDGTGFFARDELWERGASWYRQQWSWDPDENVAALDHADIYTQKHRFAQVPERIHRTASSSTGGFEPKFIYVVRDPIDRIVSHYNQILQAGPADAGDPDHAHVALDDHLIDVSRYAAQLEPFRRQFGREALRLVRLRDLMDDPTRTVTELLEWLSVPLNVEFEPPPATPDSDQRLWQTSQPLRPFDHNQSRAFAAAGAQRRRELLETPSVRRQRSLTDTQRRRVSEALAEDVERLRDRYDLDVDHWRID